MLKQKKILITIIVLLILIIEVGLVIFLSHTTKLNNNTSPSPTQSPPEYRPNIVYPQGGAYENDFSLGQYIISDNNLVLLTTAILDKVYTKNNAVYIDATLMNNAKKVKETFITSAKSGKSLILSKQKDAAFLTENPTTDTKLSASQASTALQPFLNSNIKILLPMYTSVWIGKALGTNPTITITPPISPDMRYIKCNAALSQSYKNSTDLPQCLGIISTVYVYTGTK